MILSVLWMRLNAAENESETPIYISPKYDREIIKGGGGPDGREDLPESENIPKKKKLKSRYKHK
jgi:hypothetical protein